MMRKANSSGSSLGSRSGSFWALKTPVAAAARKCRRGILTWRAFRIARVRPGPRRFCPGGWRGAEGEDGAQICVDRFRKTPKAIVGYTRGELELRAPIEVLAGVREGFQRGREILLFEVGLHQGEMQGFGVRVLLDGGAAQVDCLLRLSC